MVLYSRELDIRLRFSVLRCFVRQVQNEVIVVKTEFKYL